TLNPQSLELQFESIDMHQLIQNAVTSNQLIAQETGGTIEMNLEATSCYVNGDRVHMTNILYNLMDNALKYCEGHPEIQVNSRNEGKWFVFEIRDNGIGIPAKYQSQVFDQFFRVPKGNRHDVKGFGLGLYYVRTIVQSHKGKINLSSTIDKGSSFTIHLPMP
ncbi:MAG: sensor histidine kinase, partial [Flavobacteriales bacterium]